MSPLNPRDSEDPINPEISAVYPKARGGQEGRGLTEVMGAKVMLALAGGKCLVCGHTEVTAPLPPVMSPEPERPQRGSNEVGGPWVNHQISL